MPFLKTKRSRGVPITVPIGGKTCKLLDRMNGPFPRSVSRSYHADNPAGGRKPEEAVTCRWAREIRAKPAKASRSNGKGSPAPTDDQPGALFSSDSTRIRRVMLGRCRAAEPACWARRLYRRLAFWLSLSG